MRGWERNEENPAVLCFFSVEGNIIDGCEWAQAIPITAGTLEVIKAINTT